MSAKCSGKVAFDSFTDARKQAQTGRRRHEVALVAYKCRECGQYHVGSRDKRNVDSKTKPLYHRQKSRNRLCLVDKDSD